MKKKTPKYSQVARARYHNDRTKNPAKYGIARNGTKDMYSFGFVDALYSINNRSAVKNEFGSKKANSYNLGHIAGTKCRNSYQKKTKKGLSEQL